MICGKCGNLIREDSKFCGVCGARVIRADQRGVSAPTVNETSYASDDPTRRNKLVALATVIVLLMILAVSTLTIMRKDNSVKSTGWFGAKYVIRYPEKQVEFQAENGAEVKIIYVEVFDTAPSEGDLQDMSADIADENSNYDLLSIRFYDAQPDGSRPEDYNNNRDDNGIISENGRVFVFNSEIGAEFGNYSEPTRYGEKYEEDYDVGTYVYTRENLLDLEGYEI